MSRPGRADRLGADGLHISLSPIAPTTTVAYPVQIGCTIGDTLNHDGRPDLRHLIGRPNRDTAVQLTAEPTGPRLKTQREQNTQGLRADRA